MPLLACARTVRNRRGCIEEAGGEQEVLDHLIAVAGDQLDCARAVGAPQVFYVTGDDLPVMAKGSQMKRSRTTT